MIVYCHGNLKNISPFCRKQKYVKKRELKNMFYVLAVEAFCLIPVQL